MNKTVNINLAGIFFHIDEDAYLKLQRYLDAIKRSFTDSQGRAEIIADIEARIAELFSERVQNERQVISVKQVDEVITIMGQPEDYLVDEEIFEDEPKKSYSSKSSKKLFRDKDNSYIAGVASGLSHYLGIEVIWVRLLWVLLIFGSGGTAIFIYILFWILVPEAVTTSEKLTMKGEPVNISNIEKKIKDGIDNVSDTVKSIDYEKYGDKIKSNSKSFFDTIGDIIMFFLKLFAKFFGVILILASAAALLGVIISSISLSSSSIIRPWWMDYPDALNMSGVPIWVGSILLFFLFGIPLFFLLYLGLKILVTNLKSIGNVAKYTLLGLWLLSLVSVISIGINYATEFSQETISTEMKSFQPIMNDTLQVVMTASKLDTYKHGFYRSNGFEIKHTDEGDKKIFSRNLEIFVKSTKDSLITVRLEKEAKGRDYDNAKSNAENIEYHFEMVNNQLVLNNFLMTNFENKFHDQKVNIRLFIPEGTFVKFDKNTSSFVEGWLGDNNILSRGDVGQTLKIMENEVKCMDCENDAVEVNININKNGKGVKINNESVNIKSDSLEININGKGIKADGDDVKVRVTEKDGVQIISQ